jgi:GT2 family glycosyltransferase
VANDFDLYYRLFKRGYKFAYCNTSVYWFRLHEDQITAKESEVIESVKTYLKTKYNV